MNYRMNNRMGNKMNNRLNNRMNNRMRNTCIAPIMAAKRPIISPFTASWNKIWMRAKD